MDWSDKSVMVTGAAGFIGGHLTEALASSGAHVIAVDLLQQFENIDFDRFGDRVDISSIDITNEKEFERLNDDLDYIFHLAAYAIPSACDKNPDVAFKINVQGTFNVLRFATKKDIQKLVFPSSALLYGRYPKYLPIDEKHPIEFSGNIYNATKKIGEDLCLHFHEKNNLPVVFFRLFNAFGPRQTADYFIPTVISQAMKKKQIELWNDKPTRDFTYVLDTVQAFIKAAESKYTGGPVNIGSGREVKTGDIARQIADSFGAEIKFLNKEVTGSMRLQCDNTKAREILGWQPKIPFEEGLDRTIKWFKENPEKI